MHRMPAGTSSSGRQSARTPLIATLVAVVLLVAGYVLFRYSPRTSEASAASARCGRNAQVGSPSGRTRPHNFRRCRGGPRA